MTNKTILFIAGISGAMCVALGAMGAHALKDKLSVENMQTFETAVKYQFYHTLALILVVILSESRVLGISKFLKYSSILFIVGIILFSFSLYFLALRPLMGIGNEEMKWIGAITPFGGLSFIMAWLMLTFASLKPNNN